MTANPPNLTPEQRLDAMVQKELREFTEYPLAEALEAVALDLLKRLDAAEAPCVWNHIGGEFQQGCDKVMWLFFAPKFCPGCGHPVQVKQKEEL